MMVTSSSLITEGLSWTFCLRCVNFQGHWIYKTRAKRWNLCSNCIFWSHWGIGLAQSSFSFSIRCSGKIHKQTYFLANPTDGNWTWADEIMQHEVRQEEALRLGSRERTLFVICVIENTLSKEYRYIFGRNKIMNYCHELQWKSFKKKEMVKFFFFYISQSC